MGKSDEIRNGMLVEMLYTIIDLPKCGKSKLLKYIQQKRGGYVMIMFVFVLALNPNGKICC